MLPELRTSPLPIKKQIIYEGGIHSYRELSCFENIQIQTNAALIDDFPPEVRMQHSNSGLDTRLEYKKLVEELGKYEWGLTAACQDNFNVRISMPNKLFEYIAAGIPIVSYLTDEVSKFIDKYGIGIKISSPDQELPDALPYRKNVQNIRNDFWMEDHINKLEEVYRQLIS